MDLKQLLQSANIAYKSKSELASIDISGIQSDSRKIEIGNLFIAYRGDEYDGHLFIESAISNGAAAVIGSEDLHPVGVPYIIVKDSRKSMAYIAAAFFGYPARELTVIGVTGTDGKTTTVNLIYEILNAHGISTGMISTVKARIGKEELDTGFHVTTPESPTIQQLLKKMVQEGLTHVVLEATSHGLDQDRVDACEFDIGVVTNITHEHLDYHKDYDGYFSAKFNLIEKLAKTAPKEHGSYRTAVINHDDISYKRILERVEKQRLESIRLVEYGLDNRSLGASDITSSPTEMCFELHMNNQNYHVETSLLGKYNVSNILAAVGGVSSAIDLNPGITIDAIAKFAGVPGRMEQINIGQDFIAIVDFAHTPNALKVALETARDITAKRVIAVFGSAGLRDREKRRLMAAVSAKLADITIFTAEDPRTEDLDCILAEMIAVAVSNGAVTGRTAFSVPDRGEAIKKAVSLATADDLVIACGKGHEQSMCFGKIEYPWDDRNAMRAAISEYLGIDGPKMPYLPTQNY